MLYKSAEGLRELLEYEPVPNWGKRRCAACGKAAAMSSADQDQVEIHRVFPGDYYRMDGFVALCRRCGPPVLVGHREPNLLSMGDLSFQPFPEMPIDVLVHGCAEDFRVGEAVEAVCKNMPSDDRAKINAYLRNDNREDLDGPVVSRDRLRIEALWDWPSRKRGTKCVCDADGHCIRLHSPKLDRYPIEGLTLYIGDGMARTFQYATGSELIRDCGRRKADCEAEVDNIMERWGVGWYN
jgi:hypothetical protein